MFFGVNVMLAVLLPYMIVIQRMSFKSTICFISSIVFFKLTEPLDINMNN